MLWKYVSAWDGGEGEEVVFVNSGCVDSLSSGEKEGRGGSFLKNVEDGGQSVGNKKKDHQKGPRY